MAERRVDKGLWFCWICRQPLHCIHGASLDSTQFRVGGAWRDCHEECYDVYSEGLPRSVRAPDSWPPDQLTEGVCG